MSDVVIRVENLSKQYRLGTIGTGTLRDDVDRLWARVRGKPDPLAKIGHSPNGHSPNGGSPSSLLPPPSSDTIWALRDVSFDVKQGEVVGIIGRNGAGKSTLLKILSRITAPTSGVIKVKGRIASLLEVGTGFHPELTGRENIYLNGAILGMKRAEITKKFDEIVAFAEVEQFIDTPVKRYSSGMYVRLAFAVAAHLEPEILIVDEVLAVGDAAFQKKCLGKMGEVAREGRTVLFVSHNMNAVHELCSRGILLGSGMVKLSGTTQEAIKDYFKGGRHESFVDLGALKHGGPQKYARLSALRLLDQDGKETTSFVMNQPFVAQIELECFQRLPNAEVGLKISSQHGIAIHYLTSTWEGMKIDLEPGVHCFNVRMPKVLLYPGRYQVGLWILREGEWSDDNVQEVTFFDVIKGNVTGYPTTIEKYAFSGAEVYMQSEWRELEKSKEKVV